MSTIQSGLPILLAFRQLEKGMSLFLRRSKTDPFRKGHHIQIAPVSSSLCPVSALAAYLPHRLARYPPGPIFILSNGKYLTPSLCNQFLKESIKQIGLDPTRFSTHSFRAGAATAAAAAGLPDWLIKSLLGRWSSDAYQVYITTPPALVAAVPAALCHV